VLINRAVAVAQVKGPSAGLSALEAIPKNSQVERYPFLHAAEGEFHRRLGHTRDAEISFQRALKSAHTEPQQRFLMRKLEARRGVALTCGTGNRRKFLVC
jgi:RNA polymerase sigma-70 factor (ECF subfamily)